jgi:SAM-dependent methyltransferase
MVPERLDAMLSTLMLHHCPGVEKVFRGMREALRAHGKTVVVDPCKHTFQGFREEMGGIHFGFEPEQMEKVSQKSFTEASVEKLLGICCSSSGRCTELFIACMITWDKESAR